MALWPSLAGGRTQAGATGVGASTIGAAITASGTTHTKGEWAELVSASDAAYDGILLSFLTDASTGSADRSQLLDIGIGGFGAERVLVADIMRGAAGPGGMLMIPIRVPLGARVSARIQSALASAIAYVQLHLVRRGYWGEASSGCRATTYGANTATSAGVGISLPGADNTKGAWTEITAATTNRVKWLLPRLAGPPADTTWNTIEYYVDIGYGNSGSEQLLVSDIPLRHTSQEQILTVNPTVPADLPAGSRLVARMSVRVASSGESLSCSLIGID